MKSIADHKALPGAYPLATSAQTAGWRDILLMRGASPERFNDFVRRGPTAAIFAFITGIAASIYMWDYVSHDVIFGWLALVTLTCAYQGYAAFRRRHKPIQHISERVLKKAAIITVIAGLPWIALAVIAVTLVPPEVRGYVIIIIAGVSSAGMLLMAKIPPMAVPYIICANLPVIIASVFFDAFSSQMFSFNVVCYTWLQLYHTFNASRDELAREEARRRLLLQNNDIEEAHRQLHILAHTDPVTGLPNRRAFQNRLSAEIAALHREQGAPFVLALIDLDNFKTINDTLGHTVGDDYLAGIAQRLVQICPPEAFIARLGGDEFAVIVPAITCDNDAMLLGEKIVTALSSPMRLGNTTLAEGASVGLARAPAHSIHVDDLYSFADDALLTAKDDGRGRFALFDPVSKEKLLIREFEARLLAQSIRDGGIIVHYQPQMTLPPHHLSGVEALMRWQHPARGLVPPSAFLPLAEEHGLVLDLCEVMMRQVAADIRQWRKLNLDIGRIAVNLHALQLKSPARLMEQVDLLVAATDRPDRIVLELTEECIIGRGTLSVSRVLDDLLARGVKLSLDDFGTGYASLVHLNDLPIDEIKIDRSFTSGILGSLAKQTIIKAILDMAGARALHVVAEGIENRAQEDALLRLGCRFGQGYLYAKPVPFDHICEFVMMSPANLPRLFAVSK